MRTPIQNLYDELLSLPSMQNVRLNQIQEITEAFEKHKEVEKLEFEKAYHSGLAHEYGCMEENKYYNETFNV